MLTTVARISTLLLGMAILLAGIGALGTLLGVRAGLEGFGQGVTGAIMSAYFVAFIAGTFLCPSIIKRVGHIRAFAAMATVASASAIAHALIVNPWGWAFLRMLTGICIVGMFMAAESWLNALVSNDRRGKIFAIYTTINLLAMGLGQFLILAGDLRSFVPFAFVSILLSLALLPVALTSLREPPPVDVPHLNLRRLYAASPLSFFGGLTAGLTMGAFWGIGALFAHGIGLSNVGVAVFMSATIFGGAALQWPIGHWSDKHDRRVVLTLVCFSAGALALAAFMAVAALPKTFMMLAFLYGGVSSTVYALSISHVNDRLAPSEMLSATSGLLLLYGIGAAIGPTAAGLLMQIFGPKALLSYFAVVLVSLGLFGVYRLSARAPVPVAEQAPFVPMVRTSQAVLEMDPRAELGSRTALAPAPESAPAEAEHVSGAALTGVKP